MLKKFLYGRILVRPKAIDQRSLGHRPRIKNVAARLAEGHIHPIDAADG